MTTRVLLLACLVSTICLAADESPIIFGVRGGVPLGDVINAVQTDGSVSSATNNYVVGPTVGLRLPLGLSVTGDALFTRLSLSASTSSSLGSASAHASSWEFPVLVRFTAGNRGIAPFIGAGISVRHLSDFANIGPYLTGSASNTSAVIGTNPNVGFAIGGGLQFRVGHLHISPEIRYTRWGENQIANAFTNVIKTNDNEGQILMGLTF
jgi:opacity protein-like surface antigen